MKSKIEKDNLQIFTIWSDEVKGRIDPGFYRPEFKELEKVFTGGKYKIKTLKEIAEKISSGATPLSGGDAYTNKEEGIPFIRSGDINANKSIDFDDLLYIKKETHQTKLKSSQLLKGDVLIAIVGATIGQVSLYDYNREANINQAIAMVRIKEGVNPEYVKEYLLSEFGQSQLNKIKRPVARANINLDEVGGIRISLPPLEIQNKIVAIMQKAYDEKKQKEAEAKKLLNSIDDYVLGELGIKMLVIKKEMVFEVWSDEVEGRRMDPKAYLAEPKKIIKAIQKSKYKSKKLSEIVFENISGEWGEDPLFTENSNGYILANVLRNTNFDNKFNLNFENVAQRLITKDKFRKIQLKNGDILIEKSGGSPIQPVGRIAIFENDNENFGFSNFLQCLRISKNDYLPQYLFSYLKSIYNLGYMEYVQNQTTGIKNLIMEEYLSIPIILPPLSVQNKIAEEVKLRMQKAERLQTEAKEVLEKAKEKVEAMILGVIN